MANAKISSLTALTGANVDAAADLLYIVDISATTGKKILVSELLSVIGFSVHGLVTSNNATDADHDIDIAVGAAKDTTSVAIMSLASVLTKRIDASWAVGTNMGGLDGTESVAGTPDADTWYYLWLIQRSDTGVVDALFSESSTAPTMPTNYNRKRLIGAVRTDSSANIKPYYQDVDLFRWRAAVTVVNAGTATADTAVTLTPAVPPIAESFSATAKVNAVITAATNGFNTCIVQVAASADYATLGHVFWGASGSARTTETYGALDAVPYTGTFNYRNSTSNTNSRNSTIYVTGFRLAR